MHSFEATTVELSGTHLVEASAGTGKTYAITTLFVRLIVTRSLGIEQILVVTFTEAATTELRDRIRRRLREAVHAFDLRARGERSRDTDLATIAAASDSPKRDRQRLVLALRDVDEAAIYTIHGFCHRMLQDRAFESRVPFDAEVVPDHTALRDEITADYWTSRITRATPTLVRLLDDAGVSPSSCRALVDLAIRHPDMPVLPTDTGEVVEPDRSEFDAAFEHARGLWDEEAVGETLIHRRLHNGWYKPALVPGWCREMTEYLEAGPDVVPALFPRFDKFKATSVARAWNKGFRGITLPFFSACEELGAAHERYREAQEATVRAFKKDLVAYVRTEMRQRKHERGVMTFDDLLHRLRNAIASSDTLCRGILQRFPVALIDEFQDTDPIQYDIFERVYVGSEGTLFLIGDPKQAIYAFRGADVHAYLRAAREAQERHTMTVNWRSDPALVTAVSRLFESTPRPFLLEQIEFPVVSPSPGAVDLLRPRPPIDGAPLEVLFVEREPKEKRIPKGWADSRLLDLIAAEISTLIRSGTTIGDRHVGPGDIAILTRTNQQAFAAQVALRKLQITSVVLGDESVLESEEAAELRWLLRAVLEPTSATAIRAALTSQLLGVTANELVEIEAGETQWDQWINDFREWHAIWVEKGFVQMMRALMQRRGLQRRLLELDDGERRMTNLLHLTEILHTASTTAHLGPTALLHWYSLQQSDAKELKRRPEASQIRLESDEHAVKITTVHKSKGLEYPIVYAPYLYDGSLVFRQEEKNLVFHNPEHGDRLEVDIGSREHAEHLALARRERFAENTRLLYVALTRAKHRCTVVWGAFKDFETSSLGYVFYPNQLNQTSPPAELEGTYVNLSDVELRERLARRAAGCEGTIGVRTLDKNAVGKVVPRQEEMDHRLQCRVVPDEQRIDSWWRLTSFSGLTASSDQALFDQTEGLDRDEAEEAPDDRRATAVEEGEIVLSGFPRGAKAGNFFHEVFEVLDFQKANPLLIEEKLAAYGYEATWRETVAKSIRDVLHTPLLENEALRLRDLAPTDRLNELEFCLPVSTSAGSERLTNRRLARVFGEHPSALVPSSYADDVARLKFLPVQGYLKGFIDLVFRYQGRWFVVDYKTNHLGDDVRAYSGDRLPAAMARGHYYLQYHLYSLALHRYLCRRCPGYDYDRNFGGALYLFLKGMSPESAQNSGVFHERPPRARIDALSRALLDTGEAAS